MTILVTGATGHIGRHGVEQLLAADADVRALTRTPPHHENPARHRPALEGTHEPKPGITESNDRYTGLLCGW